MNLRGTTASQRPRRRDVSGIGLGLGHIETSLRVKTPTGFMSKSGILTAGDGDDDARRTCPDVPFVSVSRASAGEGIDTCTCGETRKDDRELSTRTA